MVKLLSIYFYSIFLPCYYFTSKHFLLIIFALATTPLHIRLWSEHNNFDT